MTFRFRPLLAALGLTAGLAACAMPADRDPELAAGTPGPAGSIETRDTWAPGWLWDVEDQEYYRIRGTDEQAR